MKCIPIGMPSILILFFIFLCNFSSLAQNKDEQAVRKILQSQTEEWNKGNIVSFMSGYWQNDSLLFVGSTGANYGFANTLKNYQKGYPDTAAMGKLNFDILQVKPLSDTYYFVLGKWHLTRSIGNLNGFYTLLFKKINGQWKIVVDHSS